VQIVFRFPDVAVVDPITNITSNVTFSNDVA
jgi:hypothetical protein